MERPVGKSLATMDPSGRVACGRVTVAVVVFGETRSKDVDDVSMTPDHEASTANVTVEFQSALRRDTMMLKRMMTATVAAVAITMLSLTAAAREPDGIAATGVVSITRPGLVYTMPWEIEFCPAVHVEPGFRAGVFVGTASGHPVAGWWVYSEELDRVRMAFWNEFNTECKGRLFDISTDGRPRFVLSEFSDNDGNVLHSSNMTWVFVDRLD